MPKPELSPEDNAIIHSQRKRWRLVIFMIAFVFIGGVTSFFVFNELDCRNAFIKKETSALLVAIAENNITMEGGNLKLKTKPTPSPVATEPAAATPANANGTVPLADANAAAPKPNLDTAKSILETSTMERYEKFVKQDRHWNRLGWFASVDTYPLLALFFLALGFLSGSLGSLLALLRANSLSKNFSDTDYLRHYLQPLLGGVVCILAGLLLVGVTSSDSIALPGLQFTYSFLSIPAPVYFISVVFSFDPQTSIGNITNFIANQANAFVPKLDGRANNPMHPSDGSAAT